MSIEIEQLSTHLQGKRHQLRQAIRRAPEDYSTLAEAAYRALVADGNRSVPPPCASLEVREGADSILTLVWQYKNIHGDQEARFNSPFLSPKKKFEVFKVDDNIDAEVAWRHGVYHIRLDFSRFLSPWERRLAWHYYQVVCEDLWAKSLTAEKLWSFVENLDDPWRYVFLPSYRGVF